MSIRNQNWYNLQATRRYPLDENSTGLDNSGQAMREDILVDCNIRFPSTYGNYLYVQGITVSAGIVTVLFGAVDSLSDISGQSVAVVSIPKPAATNVNYAITPIKPGVAGWVVLGPGIDTNFTGRYTSPRQTLLSPRCAKRYTPLPIPTLGKVGLKTSLAGVINVVGDQPIRVRYAPLAGKVVNIIDGNKVVVKTNTPALIVELDQTQITTDYNPLSEFIGPCGQRPESGTCPKPPIENINGIVPDCDGNIEIAVDGFTPNTIFGCNDDTPEKCCGIDIVTDINLQAACDSVKKTIRTFADDCCTPKLVVETTEDLQTIPVEQRTAGMLVKVNATNERWTLDENLTSWTAAASEEYCTWPDPTSQIPDIIDDQLDPQPTYPCSTIPVCAGLDFCSGNPPEFVVRAGIFKSAAVSAPPACPCDITAPAPANEFGTHNVYVSANNSGLNMAVFKNCASDWAINKTISVEFKIGADGLERNGGLMLNYLKYLQDTGLGHTVVKTTYVAVVLDVARGQLRVLRYTNTSATVEGNVATRVKINTWYRLSVTPKINGRNVAINIVAEELTAVSATDPTITARKIAGMTIQVTATAYGDIMGQCGLFANRSQAYFNKLTIVDAA